MLADLHITFHEIQRRHSHVRETTAQDTTNGTSTIVLLGVQLDFLFRHSRNEHFGSLLKSLAERSRGGRCSSGLRDRDRTSRKSSEDIRCVQTGRIERIFKVRGGHFSH